MSVTGVQRDDVGLIALAGDWHGNRAFARRAIKAAREMGAEGILQLGDFGIWPGLPGSMFLREVNSALADFGMWLAFIDGNHDDHWQIENLPLQDGVRPVGTCITHLPRGYRWTWYGKSWLALGGATSLDKSLRTVGQSWWPEEAITITQAEKVIAEGTADFMITHDAPIGAAVPGLDPTQWRKDALIEADAHRKLLQGVVDAVQPERLWHGHMHVSYRVWMPTGVGCEVRGLGSDVEGLANNLVIIDPAVV